MASPTDVDRTGVLSRIDRRLAQMHWVRLPLLFMTGIAAAVATGTWVTPRYIEFCRIVNRFAQDCRDVPPRHIVGYTIAAFGVAMLILGPVVNTLYRVYRYGQAWETPRGPETAASNIPIAVGVAYIAIGMIVALG